MFKIVYSQFSQKKIIMSAFLKKEKYKRILHDLHQKNKNK